MPTTKSRPRTGRGRGHPAQKLVEADERCRITLGKSVVGRRYSVTYAENGVIVMQPVKVVPEGDHWIHDHPELLAELLEGIAQADRGELEDLPEIMDDPEVR